jgi:iron complex outermembrane receptor protein
MSRILLFAPVQPLLPASALMFVFVGVAHAEDIAKRFDIPAQTAASGIREYAREAGLQVLVSSAFVRGKRTNAVNGELPARTALDRLIAGTGIEVVSSNGNAVVLGPSSGSEASSETDR